MLFGWRQWSGGYSHLWVKLWTDLVVRGGGMENVHEGGSGHENSKWGIIGFGGSGSSPAIASNCEQP